MSACYKLESLEQGSPPEEVSWLFCWMWRGLPHVGDTFWEQPKWYFRRKLILTSIHFPPCPLGTAAAEGSLADSRTSFSDGLPCNRDLGFSRNFMGSQVPDWDKWGTLLMCTSVLSNWGCCPLPPVRVGYLGTTPTVETPSFKNQVTTGFAVPQKDVAVITLLKHT